MTWFDASGAEMLDSYGPIRALGRNTEFCVGLIYLTFEVRKDSGFLLSQE